MPNKLLALIFLFSTISWFMSHVVYKEQSRNLCFVSIFFLYIFIAINIGLRSSYIGSDTIVYINFFNYIDISTYQELVSRYSFEIGNIITGIVINYINNDSVCFLLFYSLSIGCIYYFSARRIFTIEYSSLFMLIMMSFPFYYSITGNVIRAGMGLSIGALATVYATQNNNNKAFVSIILASAFHLSLLSYLSIFIAKSMKLKYVYLFWFLSIFIGVNFNDLSFGYENVITEKLLAYQNAVDYTDYRTGFRIDFFLFSLIPVLAYLYILINKNEISDRYIQLFKIYLVLNSIYNVFVNVAFSDRFALLSWMLIPFLLVEFFFNLNSKVINALVCMCLPISFYLVSKQYLFQ